MSSTALRTATPPLARHPVPACICSDLCGAAGAARSLAAAALFLGRSRILRSGGARSAAHRKPDSALHAFERTSTAGDGLSGAVVEARRLRAFGHPHRHASGRSILSAGLFPAGEERRQCRSRDRDHYLCTALYPVFFAQSSLAHLDLAAAGFTFWGLHAYVKDRGMGDGALVFARQP